MFKANVLSTAGYLTNAVRFGRPSHVEQIPFAIRETGSSTFADNRQADKWNRKRASHGPKDPMRNREIESKPDPGKIFTSLRKKIINLTLPPECVLNLSDLADEYNVSRTPIKEVLISLQVEEWIMRQGSHFIVTPLSLERIREITEIRMVMEAQANIWAMERITPPELNTLNQMRQRIASFSDKSDNQSMIDLDSAIHKTIFSAAKNAQLEKLLERLLGHYLRFWLSIPRQIDHSTFFQEVNELINAINTKDKDRIRECTTNHISKSVAQIMGAR